MRLRSVAGGWLLTFLLLATIGGSGRAQFGGFDMKNPESMFNWYVQVQYAAEELEIDKIQKRMDPEIAGKLKAYAEKNGVANGKLTKAQFIDFWTKEAMPVIEERVKQRGNGFGGFGRPPGGPGPAPNQPMPPPTTEKTTGNTGDNNKQQPQAQPQSQPPGFRPRPFNKEEVEKVFKHLDRDQSDALEAPEYRHSNIRREVDRWDANKNKVIELDEFLAFQEDRHNEREEDRKAMMEEAEAEKKLLEEFREYKRNKMQADKAPPGPILPDRPPQVRAGTLPRELPPWFRELDADQDAQVGLYEWRKSDKGIDEFRKYDRNNDGLLTSEEVLWVNWYADRVAGVPLSSPPVGGPPRGKAGWNGFGGRDKSARDGFPQRP